MSDLREHLIAAGIAGEVGTTRENNLRNAGRMAGGQSGYDFGLVPRRAWSTDDVVDVMHRLCGISADLDHVEGVDTIDPDLTLGALERWRVRLAAAASGRERVLLATGHPTGVLALHLAVAAALRGAGCEVLVASPDWSWPWEMPDGQPASKWAQSRPRHVRCIGGVHVLSTSGELLHTHAPEPMRAVLTALADAGAAPPSLVVADHGWAGVTAEAGIDTLALADCNDPALFVAEAEGKPIVTVPMDDNVLPHLYDPLAEYVTRW